MQSAYIYSSMHIILIILGIILVGLSCLRSWQQLQCTCDIMWLLLVRKHHTGRKSTKECNIKFLLLRMNTIGTLKRDRCAAGRMSVSCLYCHAPSPCCCCCCMCFIVKQRPRQTGLIHRFIYGEAITRCGPAAAPQPHFSLNLSSPALQRLRISECNALSFSE